MIGTWIAAFLAIVALVGIIGPTLIFGAVYSDRSKALSAIHDLHERFVTRGIGLGRKTRIFHIVKVPCLAPIIDWSNTTPFRIPQSDSVWKLQAFAASRCQNGWTKMCSLLGAYEINLDKAGDLVFYEQHAWLPVSRYWTLTLGLLGRYACRNDKGTCHYPDALRRDLNEERVLHIDGELDQGSDTESESQDFDDSPDSRGNNEYRLLYWTQGPPRTLLVRWLVLSLLIQSRAPVRQLRRLISYTECREYLEERLRALTMIRDWKVHSYSRRTISRKWDLARPST
jgi:hypothetical protein